MADQLTAMVRVISRLICGTTSMRFKRYEIRYEEHVTNRRILAAKRRLQREVDSMPLFADEVRASQPTPEELVARHNDGWRQACEEMRRHTAEAWLRGRAILRSLPPEQHAKLLAEWNNYKWCPGSSEYFLDFLHTRLKGQAK